MAKVTALSAAAALQLYSWTARRCQIADAIRIADSLPVAELESVWNADPRAKSLQLSGRVNYLTQGELRQVGLDHSCRYDGACSDNFDTRTVCWELADILLEACKQAAETRRAK